MKGTHDVVLSPVQYENIRMYFRDVRREVALTISKLIKLQSCVYNFQEYHRKASDFLVFLKSNMTLWQNEQTKYIKKDDGLNELEEWYSKYICKELIYYTLKYTYVLANHFSVYIII